MSFTGDDNEFCVFEGGKIEVEVEVKLAAPKEDGGVDGRGIYPCAVEPRILDTGCSV